MGESKFLEKAFAAMLYSDGLYALILMAQEKRSTWAQVLKIACDRTSDITRRVAYWNLHKYAKQLGI